MSPDGIDLNTLASPIANPITEATRTHTTVQVAALDAWASAVRCPRCNGDGFDVTWRLVPRPKGTYSLAGVQDKVAAVETPVLVCSSGCGLEKTGKRP